MSTRPRIPAYTVIDGESMASDITSQVTIIQSLSVFSYSYTWTGSTPVGTISVQVSNDYEEDAQGGVANAGTWSDLPVESNGVIVTAIPLTGNSGQGFVDIELHGAYAVRTFYDRTSGTGNLTAILNAKVT